MILLALPQIYTRVFHLWKTIDLHCVRFGNSHPFSLVISCAFRDVPNSRVTCGDPNQWLPNILKMLLLALPQIYTCISLVEVYRFPQCLDGRFSPLSTFFSLVSSCTFREAPHAQFWFWDLKLCLVDFLKMLDLAVFHIYTRVFYLW